MWVGFAKDDESREIPLLKYAARYLAGLVRYLNTPYVFVNSQTGRRWVNPDKSLRRAAKSVGLKVGTHDLRGFRCSQRLMQGVDVRTVQKPMGHSATSTIMRMQGASVPMRCRAFGRHRRTKTHKCNGQETRGNDSRGETDFQSPSFVSCDAIRQPESVEWGLRPNPP